MTPPYSSSPPVAWLAAALQNLLPHPTTAPEHSPVLSDETFLPATLSTPTHPPAPAAVE